MKKIVLCCLITIICFLFRQNSFSQSIDKKTQVDIIEKLLFEMKRIYPDKEKGIKIENILTKLKDQTQESINTSDFCEHVTGKLIEATGDKHFNLYYNPEKFIAFSQNDSARIQYAYETEKPLNFGFKKVEILKGNIGYINLEFFTRLVGEIAGGLVDATMNLIENSDALIIDMRYNSGGDGRMSEYFRTYFFPEAGFTYYDSISKQEKYFTSSYVPGKRYLNKPVYILIGKGTFSAAEDFSYFMRKYRKAVLVGEKTPGSGPGGSSVPIIHDFLCFIPIDNYAYEFEKSGVKPDFSIEGEKALDYATYHILKSQKKEFKTDDEKEIYEWNLLTMEYLLGLLSINNNEFNKEFTGNYEMSRTIFLKDNKPFIKTQGKEFELIKIQENVYVLDSDLRFGKGNSRLFLIKSGSEIKVIHKILSDKIHSKDFKKI